MGKEIRSIIGYYGGKHRMSHYIAERLDYANCDTYFEMFGGGARVLLNKPRHEHEMYLDYSACLTALMGVISNEYKADEFIHRVYETDYSREEFERAKAIVDFVESDPLSYYSNAMRDALKSLFIKYDMLSENATKRDIDKILKDESSIGVLRGNIEKETLNVKDEIYSGLIELLELYQYMEDDFRLNGSLKRNQDYDVHQTFTDMEIAVATYVVYTQSRDNMGKYWSGSKFKSNEAYRKHIEKLYDCAERMKNVNVYQLDASIFYRKLYSGDKKTMNEWLMSPKLMIYADPSYISPVEESKLLEGIDIAKASWLSKEIIKNNKGKNPKNLGGIYAMSFNYIQQEYFVRSIQNAKCKIMVSNYDLELYNKYLNEDTGWKKLYFETSTSVGNKAGNKRVECLWYNY